MFSAKPAIHNNQTTVEAEEHLLKKDSDYQHGQQNHTSRRASRTWIHASVITVEVILAGLLLIGFMLLNKSRLSQTSVAPTSSFSSLDGLQHLNSYTSTTQFQNNSVLLKDSNEANKYWRELLDTGGVVALDTQWALGQGLRKSATSPTDNTKSIYQVDVFHALHCLNAIRENLVPEKKPEWNEKHMLHCLDYVRHQLLCHPDLTLVSTKDLDEFVLDETHQCKDYTSVVGWVNQHRWVEFPEYINNKTKSG